MLHAKLIGHNTRIYQNVTIGYGNSKSNRGYPTIGKNCHIFSGAVVLGGIEIGDNTIIGANAVVMKSTRPHSVVTGVPARELRIMQKDDPMYVE